MSLRWNFFFLQMNIHKIGGFRRKSNLAGINFLEDEYFKSNLAEINFGDEAKAITKGISEKKTLKF